MKKWMKIGLIILVCMLVLAGAWHIAGFRFYSLPTASMENTVPVGSKLLTWRTNFIPDRFDIIIFRNPEGDTIVSQFPLNSYYQLVREYGKEYVERSCEKQFVPLNEREEWVGRCVALPGDTLHIVNSDLYIDGEIYEAEGVKKLYQLKTGDSRPPSLNDYGIKNEDVLFFNHKDSTLMILATSNQLERMNKDGFVILYTHIYSQEFNSKIIFPHSDLIAWDTNNFGPIVMPKKDVAISLTLKSLPIYERLIKVYEQNDLTVVDEQIYINGQRANEYIPKMNYYFIISDNRDNSIDSRYWGFLPENHISQKVLCIW